VHFLNRRTKRMIKPAKPAQYPLAQMKCSDIGSLREENENEKEEWWEGGETTQKRRDRCGSQTLSAARSSSAHTDTSQHFAVVFLR
jgi:hypothetical protein